MMEPPSAKHDLILEQVRLETLSATRFHTLEAVFRYKLLTLCKTIYHLTCCFSL